MTLRVECAVLVGVGVSYVGCGVSPRQSFFQQRITKEVRDREDAITNTRGPSRTGVACATQGSSNGRG
jgi:hypothetical protein